MKQKTFKIANDLSKDGCDVKISFAPPDLDLGAMTKKAVSDLILKAEHYDPMSALRYKISQISSGSTL